MNSVILEPTSIGKYIQSENEPQMIQERSHNCSIIYLDSQDSRLELNKTNMLMSSIKNIGDRADTLFQTIRRYKVISSGINWITPNVNIRNNNIIFLSSNTGSTQYSVIIQEGFYTSASSLMTAIVNAMNTVSVSSGLTFSQTSVTGYTDKFNLVSTGGNYLILLTCNAVTNGDQLYALPNTTVAASTNIVGSISLWYTRYIDICSQRLNNYTKIRTESTGYNSNIVFRVFIDDPTKTHVIGFIPSSESNTINFLSSDSISTIDFQLKDQFGNYLYIPSGGGLGNQSGFFWDMQILVEF